MLDRSRELILERLDEGDLVLDVGGWGKPFPRADWALDMQPYETRGLYGYEDISASEERFDAGTWVVRDICEREPWPFEDNRFDFVVCSHTLEDVRDPIWVCSELSRVGQAGYIEVPSRLEEQALGIQGDWVGWDHHRWLCDPAEGGIEFVFKAHYIHAHRDCQLRSSFVRDQPMERRRVVVWWDGEVAARERIMGSTEELHQYLSSYVSAVVEAEGGTARPPTRLGALFRRA